MKLGSNCFRSKVRVENAWAPGDSGRSGNILPDSAKVSSVIFEIFLIVLGSVPILDTLM